jgi:MFS-type transporter involved in bile tolerance (Atg22 family)
MDTHIARVIPAGRLARVYTLQRVTVAGVSAPGVFAVAVVTDATSGALAIAVAGTAMVLTGLLALLKIRDIPNGPVGACPPEP